jgi:glycosyltransferase involved in cell wall biosynthesis
MSTSSSDSFNASRRPVIAFGPELPGIGSWEWVGAEMVEELSVRFETKTFKDEIPSCDVLVIVKYNLSHKVVERVARHSLVVFCPIDYYGSPAEIDRDGPLLRCCARVVTHAESLRKYFQSYAPVEYLDHHVKFTAPLREAYQKTGPILWTGMRNNLPPLVQWINGNPLPEELWLLTNLEAGRTDARGEEFGFSTGTTVRIENWSPEKHYEWTGLARAAIDVKGTDFRQRHKPPAKAFDFIASGVPTATNDPSSSARHLRRIGFEPARPEERDRWLSRDYWEQTVRLGRRLRDRLSRAGVGARLAQILEDVLTARETERTEPAHFAMALPIEAGRGPAQLNPERLQTSDPAAADPLKRAGEDCTKVAIVSFLFNWPSTGGGIIHTVELAQFLQRAGYDVRVFCPRYAPWGIGNVSAECPFPPVVLEFDEPSWQAERIGTRFRAAVDDFAPDTVILTDCWNFKPHLARALNGHRVVWRMQALECLCPLNNLRLLADKRGFRQCPQHQLATPDICWSCLEQRGRHSGALHRAERELSGVGTTAYDELLRQTLREAHAVLTLNRTTAEMFRPYTADVRVVTWGMDQARFPREPVERPAGDKTRLFFAGLVAEGIKGFAVLQAGCRQLWRKRQDFELIATGEPAGSFNEFTRYVGWLSQAELPAWYARTDVTIVPTIAQEGLSRTAVEAFAAGRPVIGSRIGGLPDTVTEGVTGLLAEPGNAADLAAKIELLLDRPDLRAEMGRAARRRFEESYLWERVIEQQYQPLFGLVRSPVCAET